MDENLVGYLLKALEADEHRAVEEYLRGNTERQRRLEKVRRHVDRLAADAVDADPPEGLWVRTLATIAEYKCRNLPYAPLPSASQKAGGRTWWRRVDVLVAAVLLLVVGGVLATWLFVARDREQMMACQENLRRFHSALWAYSESHPEGKFPEVQAQPPAHMAGFFVPLLHDAGQLPANITATCPGVERRTVPVRSVAELEALRREHPDEFRDVARTLGGCYAYTLGYREGEGNNLVHRGLTNKMDGRLPIMADRPPPGIGTAEALALNSPNHAGRGQNVLFIAGNVEFSTTRTIGVRRDDIFVNVRGDVGAGYGPFDTVLGRGDAEPYPRPND